VLSPSLPGQPNGPRGVGRRHNLEITTRRMSQPNDIRPSPRAARFSRRIKTIEYLPISFKLLAPGHDHSAHAVDGNRRPPNVESFVRHGDGGVPDLAVEAQQPNLVAV